MNHVTNFVRPLAKCQLNTEKMKKKNNNARMFIQMFIVKCCVHHTKGKHINVHHHRHHHLDLIGHGSSSIRKCSSSTTQCTAMLVKKSQPRRKSH